MKYKYEIVDNKVVAFCNYAGKRIQATATCCSEDSFNLETGKTLAAKRLDIKIAEKRYKRAQKRLEKARIKAMIAIAEVEDRYDYLNKMENTLLYIEEDYDALITELM